MSTQCGPEVFGADPAIIKWTVIRGDSSSLKVEFLQDDEVTTYDTSDWLYRSNAYDPKTDIVDPLEITKGDGFVTLSISPEVSEYWGTRASGITAELNFDLEVTIDETVWTPVIGSISVIADSSYGTSKL